jgi:hypothetical protein
VGLSDVAVSAGALGRRQSAIMAAALLGPWLTGHGRSKCDQAVGRCQRGRA